MNVLFMIGRLICRITKKHRFVDESQIGPESGIEEFSCSRCGFHFRHIYY